MTDLTERQKIAARIAGAIAHELNNPLQGVLSMFAMYKADLTEPDQQRLIAIQGGLARISQIVESISVIYENLPRCVEQTTVGSFLDSLVAALDERRIRTKILNSAPRDLGLYALVPETVRLIQEAFSLSSPEDSVVSIEAELLNGRALLACERQSLDATEPWGGLNGDPVCSGLAVLIDEVTRLAGGEPEFRFDHASLSGIRLCFRTRMN